MLASLDPQNELNALRSAQAALWAARASSSRRATITSARATLSRGITTQVAFDQAQQAMRTAQSRVDSAQAQLHNAEDRVGFTELQADAPGVVTARRRRARRGRAAGQMIVQVARQDGRDAVFDVPAQVMRTAPRPDIAVRLTDDPAVKATGRVREVERRRPIRSRARSAVRVGLTDPPAAMRSARRSTGRMKLASSPRSPIPASALTNINGQPAVWIVDPATRPFDAQCRGLRFDPATVVISQASTPAISS